MSQQPPRIVKNVGTPPQERDSIAERKARTLKRISDFQAELGRLNKLADEIRADVLHEEITTE